MGFLFLQVVVTMAGVAFMGHDHTLHGHRLATLPYIRRERFTGLHEVAVSVRLLLPFSPVGALLHRQGRVFLAGHPLTSML